MATGWDPNVQRFRDADGQFAKVARRLLAFDADERRSSRSAPRPPMSEQRRRERKNALKDAADLARGARPPRDRREERDLQWASPRKMAEQRALTGDIQMPRLEALRRNVRMIRQGLLGGFGARERRTMVVENPFTGRFRALRGVVRADDDAGLGLPHRRPRRRR